jgi:allantoicase
MSAAFTDLIDLASERLGGAAILANDEFFASKDNLVKPSPAIWIEGKYTDRGKWMDGWETRRRREPGAVSAVSAVSYDWCILRLGTPGIVHGVDVDTSFFKGNYPESCAIDSCDLPHLAGAEAANAASWREILPRTALAGDAHNLFPVTEAPKATHVRLRILPDGGVARLRIYGDVVVDWARLAKRGDVDLAAAEHGGLVVACSDMFFGSRHNLIMPGDAQGMADGWETKRRRGPGHDWTIVRLGTRGAARRIEVDTRHFKGNAPGSCSVEACTSGDAAAAPDGTGNLRGQTPWQELLPQTPLQPNARHVFEDEVRAVGDVTHVRFNIFPDGGVGRLRVYGRPRT